MTDLIEHDQAMKRARQRARQLRDFYGHLVSYVLVCTLLVVIDLATQASAAPTFVGLNWAYWPIIGWGIAVVIHAISVFLPMQEWEARKTQELYEKERTRELQHH